MESLWDRVCISYGTLPITHKLNFGKICVHEILMGPCVYFLWDPSHITHKLNFGKVCVHEILMGPLLHF